MRTFATLVIALVLLTQVRSAPEFPPATELDVEAKLQEVRKQQERLKAEEAELQKQLASAKAQPMGGISAEVAGVLRSEQGTYFIVFRTKYGNDVKVWLDHTSHGMKQVYDKLIGKEVIATGSLLQTEPSLPHVPGSPVAPSVPGEGTFRRDALPGLGLYIEAPIMKVKGASESIKPSLPPSVVPSPPPAIPPLLPAIPK